MWLKCTLRLSVWELCILRICVENRDLTAFPSFSLKLCFPSYHTGLNSKGEQFTPALKYLPLPALPLKRTSAKSERVKHEFVSRIQRLNQISVILSFYDVAGLKVSWNIRFQKYCVCLWRNYAFILWYSFGLGITDPC